LREDSGSADIDPFSGRTGPQPARLANPGDT
jgi:hypothetical protein